MSRLYHHTSAPARGDNGSKGCQHGGQCIWQFSWWFVRSKSRRWSGERRAKYRFSAMSCPLGLRASSWMC